MSKVSNRTDADSCTPYTVMTKDEMRVRMKKLHDELRRIQKLRDRMRELLDTRAEKHGVTVNEEMHRDLKSIIETEGNKNIQKECNSFQRIFWQQQVLAASKQDARGMRWHPLMIKWCIYLRYLSSGLVTIQN